MAETTTPQPPQTFWDKVPVIRENFEYLFTGGIDPADQMATLFYDTVLPEDGEFRKHYYPIGFNPKDTTGTKKGKMNHIASHWMRCSISPSGAYLNDDEPAPAEFITRVHDVNGFLAMFWIHLMKPLANGFMYAKGFNGMPVFGKDGKLAVYNAYQQSLPPRNDYGTVIDPVIPAEPEPEPENTEAQ